MSNHPFDPNTSRRRTIDEMAQWVEEQYGSTLVNGFDQYAGGHGEIHYKSRVASFGEFVPYEAWYLNQQTPGGSICWLSAPVPENPAPHVLFLLSIGLGNGSALPQPTGRFDLYVEGEPVVSLRVLKHSETWADAHYSVRRLETAPPGMALILVSVLREVAFASFGLLAVRVPRERLRPGQPARLEVRSYNRASSTQWIKVDRGTNVRFHSNFYPALEALTRGRQAPHVGEHRVYFGDIHNHSGDSTDGLATCGTGTVDENYTYARDVSNLDFYALTEHDWQTGPAHWETLMQKVEAYNAPGRFATLPAFEWTSLVYGHRNVYYADAHQPFFLSWQEALAGGGRRPMAPGVDSPHDLWRKLEQLGTMAITAPHHPLPHPTRSTGSSSTPATTGSSRFTPPGVPQNVPRTASRAATPTGTRTCTSCPC